MPRWKHDCAFGIGGPLPVGERRFQTIAVKIAQELFRRTQDAFRRRHGIFAAGNDRIVFCGNCAERHRGGFLPFDLFRQKTVTRLKLNDALQLLSVFAQTEHLPAGKHQGASAAGCPHKADPAPADQIIHRFRIKRRRIDVP